MSLWAARRKALYTGIFLLVLIVFVGIPTFLLFYEKPTCFDGRENQGEGGVDCGGPCIRLCAADFALPRTIWERFYPITENSYNLIAYVENQNLNVGAANVPYIFKLYDNTGLIIIEREGRISVPPGRKFAVFEPSVSVGERVPVRVTFEFNGTPVWENAEDKISEIRISGVRSSNDLGFERIEATLTNTSRDLIEDLEAVVVVYDTSGNVMAFSRTSLDKLYPDSPSQIIFTWTGFFIDSISRIEILPRPKILP